MRISDWSSDVVLFRSDGHAKSGGRTWCSPRSGPLSSRPVPTTIAAARNRRPREATSGSTPATSARRALHRVRRPVGAERTGKQTFDLLLRGSRILGAELHPDTLPALVLRAPGRAPYPLSSEESRDG